MDVQPATAQSISHPEVDLQQESEGCSVVETIKTIALFFFGALCSFIGGLALYQFKVADALFVALPCFLTTGLVLWKILHRTQTPIATIEASFRSQVKEHAQVLMETLEPMSITHNFTEEQNRYTQTLIEFNDFHELVKTQVARPHTKRARGTCLSPNDNSSSRQNPELNSLLAELNNGSTSYNNMLPKSKTALDVWQQKVTDMNKGHSRALKEMSEWRILAQKELRYLTEEQLDLSEGPRPLPNLFTKPQGLLLMFPDLLLPLQRFQEQTHTAFEDRQHALGRAEKKP